MPKIKAVLHDWDDTVTASFETYKDWYWEFAEYFNLPAPNVEIIKKHWGKIMPDLVHGVWPHLSLRESRRMLEIFRPVKSYDPPLLYGVKSVIKRLYRDGYLLGIVSSAQRSKIEQMRVKHFGKTVKYHQFIICMEDKKFHKPDPRYFNEAVRILNAAGTNENETLYVGDHEIDYLATKKRGIRFVAVTTGLTSKESFLKIGVPKDSILSSFRHVYKVI